MRTFLSFWLTLIVSAIAFGTEPILPQIKQATVFRHGCHVVRVAQVPLRTGTQEIVFGGFGAGFDINSVQVKPSSTTRIVSISFENNFLNPLEKKPEYKALINDMKAITLKYQQEEVILESLTAEQDLLLANKVVGGTEAGLNPEFLTRVADVYRTRLPEIKNKIILSRLTLEVIGEQKQKIEQQIADMQTKHPQQESLEVHVTVDASLGGTQPIELSYFHQSAGWSTAYDLRVKSLTEPIELTNKGLVWQTTGEDWSQVSLRVSTGSPSRQMQPSLLSTLQLDYQLLYAEMYGISSQKMDVSNMRTSAPTQKRSEISAEGPIASVRENLTFLEYQLAGFSTLLSTPKTTTFELDNQTIKAEYKYHVVPKRDKFAFLQAYISNWQEYNLSDGEMSIFFEGTFVGKNQFNPRQVKDTLALSLGPDIAVQVKRENIKEKCKTGTLFGKSSKDVAVRIVIRNNKPNPINITILDQIPVSVQESIEIDVEQLSGGDLEKETGIITWNETINTGQSATKEIAYRVKYQKGKTIGEVD
jgi:uncharacterized protein (TIGR02231 family)